MTNETPLQVAERIERETGEWLREHGYHPTVAHLHIEAIHLQNKVLSVEVMKELLSMTPQTELPDNPVHPPRKPVLVQVYNPRSRRYIKVDKTVGGIIGHGKRDGKPYKGIPIMSKAGARMPE